MMTCLRGWCLRLVSACTLLVLLVALVPVAGAQVQTQVDWFGWGVDVDFRNNTWQVRYITYLGSNSPKPRVIPGYEKVEDISARCTKGGPGNLIYPTPDSAYFDGDDYLQCSLPSLRSDLLGLGYTPPVSGEFCPCQLGGGPLWVDGQVKQITTSGTMPLIDAGDRGVRMSLVVNGAKVGTKLDVTRTQPPGGFISYTTPEWKLHPAGNRTMVGWDGDAIVAVADHFDWLRYLTGQWRPHFHSNVSGNKIGYWNESLTTTEQGTSTITGNYRVGMNAGTVYIGYSPSTGKYFKGEIDDVGLEPGCSGS